MRIRTVALAAAGILAASPPAADAFCGFYVGGAGAKLFNNATQVVLMRHGTTTVLSMQNDYQGPPEGFALIVPVPVVVKEAQVKILPREVFERIDALGAPRLVEYWERDPCYVPAPAPPPDLLVMLDDETAAEPPPSSTDSTYVEYKVTVEARFAVGEYDIAVLSAKESTGLDRYLRDQHYQIPAGAEPLLRPYVEAGTKFFVAKVDPAKVRFEGGHAVLSPLRVDYDSPDFTLPVRLGLANSAGTQDLIVNVLAPATRYEVANYPNVMIPTNLPVKDAVRTRFGEFYAALFDHAIRAVPHAVVTEYAWDATKCDPCPGPALDPTDLLTLGGDVLGATYQDAGFTWAMTLTRLHARYGKDLGDDLVFKAVAPIMGGVGMPGPAGELPVDLDSDGRNLFQGRYVILHRWTGALACAAPVRGVWEGPPGAQLAAPIAATGTASAPRGRVALASLVSLEVPAIGVLDSADVVPVPAVRLVPLPLQPGKGRPSTCGCASQGGAAGSALLALGVLAIALRRRRST